MLREDDGIGKELRAALQVGQASFRTGAEVIETGAQELFQELGTSQLSWSELRGQLQKMVENSPQQLVSDVGRSIVLSVFFVEAVYFCVAISLFWLTTALPPSGRLWIAAQTALASRGTTRGLRLLAELWRAPKALTSLLTIEPKRRPSRFRRGLLQILLLLASVVAALVGLDASSFVSSTGSPLLLLACQNPVFKLIDTNGDGMLAASELLESAKGAGAWVWENGLRVAAAGGPLRNLLGQLTVDDWLIDAAKCLWRRFVDGVRSDFGRVLKM